MTRNPVGDGENFSAVYWSGMTNAHDDESILSGCAPSKGTGDWDVDIASGTAIVDGDFVDVSAQTETLTDPSSDADLDSGEARVDLITVNSSGTTNTTEGTAASGNKQPVAPDIPSSEVLIAAVFVDGDASSLSGSDIHDYRILSPAPTVSTTDDGSDITLHQVDNSTGSNTVVNVTGAGVMISGIIAGRTLDSVSVTVDGGTTINPTSVSVQDDNVDEFEMADLPTVRFESSLTVSFDTGSGSIPASGQAWVKQ